MTERNDRPQRDDDLGGVDPRSERLFAALMPVPEPPRDLAARVLARLHEAAPAVTRELALVPALPAAAAVAHPAPLSRPSWTRARVAVAVVAALAAGVTLWVRRAPNPNTGVAFRRADAAETIAIGARAAAAVEVATELGWTARAQDVRVEQRRGAVVYRVEKGGPFRVVTAAGEVEVTGTRFRVAAAFASIPTTDVHVLEGGVRVTSGGVTLALVAGQGARLVRGQAPALNVAAPPSAAPPSAPAERPPAPITPTPPPSRAAQRPAALLLPYIPRQPGLPSQQVFARDLGTVSLALPAGRRTGAVEVAEDPAFARPIFRGRASAGFVTVAAPARGDLYWRVPDTDAMAHARFRPDSTPAHPIAGPHNVITQDRDSTTIHFQSGPPALTLTWPASPGAQRYRVRVTRASAPERLVLERLVAATTIPIDASALAEGAYVWSVLPVGDAALPVGATTVRRFQLIYDNAVTALTVQQVRRVGSQVDVAGVAPLATQLSINGREARVDDKGRFTQRVPRPGRALVFRLVDRDGVVSYWVRTPTPTWAR
jgi:hypothetical protein